MTLRIPSLLIVFCLAALLPASAYAQADPHASLMLTVVPLPDVGALDRILSAEVSVYAHLFGLIPTPAHCAPR